MGRRQIRSHKPSLWLLALSASSLSYTDNRRLRRTSFNVSPVFVVFRATPTIKCGWGRTRVEPRFSILVDNYSTSCMACCPELSHVLTTTSYTTYPPSALDCERTTSDCTPGNHRYNLNGSSVVVIV